MFEGLIPTDIPQNFEANLRYALSLDEKDPLKKFRSAFHIPPAGNHESIYFTGNSLGLQPKKAEQYFLEELEDWKKLGVEGHVKARNPWVSYHEWYSPRLAKIVGALPEECVAMGSLTANLHFMLASFYRPTSKRFRIITEYKSFPSDLYALRSQARFHSVKNGEQIFDPEEAIIEVHPEEGSYDIPDQKIIDTIRQYGDSVALVMIGGVNYFTGTLFDLEKITTAAHETGAFAGFDLAHAAGNVSLQLHDWNVDFAAWCSYKYLNAGPGAVAGYYVHQKHHNDKHIPRLEGWWGTNKNDRFKMFPDFDPIPTAEAWQHSNAPIFNMIGLRASLELFEEAGIEALAEKSRLLNAFLSFLVGKINTDTGKNLLEIITPADPKRKGCQLSLVIPDNGTAGKGKMVFSQLTEAGIIADWREPNVIRVAPVPLYNSFEDVYHFYEHLNRLLS